LAIAQTTTEYIVPEEARDPWYAKFWGLVCRQPLGAAGGLVVLIMLFATIFAEVISPYDPEIISFESMLVPPSVDHWMGTDAFGRDILTRIIYGARTALFVGFTAAFVGSTLGLVLGVASAYFGGFFDLVVQRLVDILMAFPLIAMAWSPPTPRLMVVGGVASTCSTAARKFRP